MLPLPNLDGRVGILNVHARDKPIDADLDFKRVARATAGFTGAQLMNLMNTAAILTVRRVRPTTVALWDSNRFLELVTTVLTLHVRGEADDCRPFLCGGALRRSHWTLLLNRSRRELEAMILQTGGREM
jgi:SpoVK/Ycf46/Vps4 family AAA+-type ATPase